MHKELIIKLLMSLMLSEEIAIVHAPGNQCGNSLVAQGNNSADKAAKKAAHHPNFKCFISLPLSR
jgi:hypothetical protein